MAAISFCASVLFLLLKCELINVLIGDLDTLFIINGIYLMINPETFYFLKESECFFLFSLSTVNSSQTHRLNANPS